MWCLSRWCTLRGGRWRASGGRVVWACCACQQGMVAYSTSATALACSSPMCPMYVKSQAELLPQHAYTPLPDVYRLLRRRLGGTRGYSLLGDIPVFVQAPVMHCSGKIGKCLVSLMLALLPPCLRFRARTKVYAMLGRLNLGAVYLRELGRLVAMVVSVPGALGDGVMVDTGVMDMLRLSQVLTAS